MSEDLSKIVGERREELRGQGVRVGSDVVQAVGQRFENALVTHGATLEDFGYVGRTGARLRSRVAQSVALTQARPEVARGKTSARAQAGAAHRAAKNTHRRYHAVIEAALGDVRDAVPEETWRGFKLVLDQTRTVGASAQVLGRHMVSLAGLAEASELAAALTERKAGGAGAELRSAAASMAADVAAAKLERGTKAESEEIDVLDGLIIEDLRSIRKIARAAATDLGQQHIAEAFALPELS